MSACRHQKDTGGAEICRSAAADGMDAQGPHLVLEDWWNAVNIDDEWRLLKFFGVIC